MTMKKAVIGFAVYLTVYLIIFILLIKTESNIEKAIMDVMWTTAEVIIFIGGIILAIYIIV